MEKIIPPGDVAGLCAALRRAGHRACPVGGCVRDSLLGRAPEDWDVTTSARPEEILRLFPGGALTGGAHGTVTVPAGKRRVEVTPFRREGGYSDGRHPDRVAFGVSLEEDLSRRDFTINAMALEEDGTVTDPFGGRADLELGLIRCVGRPAVRFEEDALRMFRGVRFSAQLGFRLEEETLAAMERCAPLAERLSPERVGEEMEKTLCAPHPGRAGLWFGLGLLSSYTRGTGGPVELDSLALLPREAPVRWAGLCAALLAAGEIGDTETFLKKLRRDSRTVKLCAGAMELLHGGCPADGRGWRHALSRFGEPVCRIAAVLAGDTVLAGVIAAHPSVGTGELALSGGALAGLGLSGPEIGRAQRMLLERVLDCPADNTPERLREILEETGHI